jgi:hypothetical protein
VNPAEQELGRFEEGGSEVASRGSPWGGPGARLTVGWAWSGRSGRPPGRPGRGSGVGFPGRCCRTAGRAGARPLRGRWVRGGVARLTVGWAWFGRSGRPPGRPGRGSGVGFPGRCCRTAGRAGARPLRGRWVRGGVARLTVGWAWRAAHRGVGLVRTKRPTSWSAGTRFGRRFPGPLLQDLRPSRSSAASRKVGPRWRRAAHRGVGLVRTKRPTSWSAGREAQS